MNLQSIRQRIFGRSGRAERSYVDYRDRISVGTWLLLFGIGLSLLIDLPTVTLNFRVFRSPLNIALGDAIFAALLLAVLAAAVTESVVSLHPAMIYRRRRNTWVFWALPMALAIITPLILLQAESRTQQVIGLGVAGALFLTAFHFLYATVEPGRSGYRRGRLILDALTYGSALLLFLFVYQTRTRSVLSGSLTAFTALLLAVELLRTTTDRVSLTLVYSLVIGLILGQATWALNYWKLLPDLTGGLLLLLIFYLLTGVAQQGLQGRLSRRVLVEFAFFTLVALFLIAIGPGFRLSVQF
ncbi:MAG: hypothetical protein H6642_12925 [Caldilineaceae bacterium]|nr:hypothetical protein [Caldilineaceae bacterium]MCB9139242.1 hypothetical protein [Caldilineaceae bacterium]